MRVQHKSGFSGSPIADYTGRMNPVVDHAKLTRQEFVENPLIFDAFFFVNLKDLLHRLFL